MPRKPFSQRGTRGRGPPVAAPTHAHVRGAGPGQAGQGPWSGAWPRGRWTPLPFRTRSGCRTPASCPSVTAAGARHWPGGRSVAGGDW